MNECLLIDNPDLSILLINLPLDFDSDFVLDLLNDISFSFLGLNLNKLFCNDKDNDDELEFVKKLFKLLDIPFLILFRN